MEAMYFFETLVDFHWTIRRYIKKNRTRTDFSFYWTNVNYRLLDMNLKSICHLCERQLAMKEFFRDMKYAKSYKRYFLYSSMWREYKEKQYA
jgi:hypothetical protein